MACVGDCCWLRVQKLFLRLGILCTPSALKVFLGPSPLHRWWNGIGNNRILKLCFIGLFFSYYCSIQKKSKIEKCNKLFQKEVILTISIYHFGQFIIQCRLCFDIQKICVKCVDAFRHHPLVLDKVVFDWFQSPVLRRAAASGPGRDARGGPVRWVGHGWWTALSPLRTQPHRTPGAGASLWVSLQPPVEPPPTPPFSAPI